MDAEIVDPACDHIYRLPDHHHSVATASCEPGCLGDKIPLLAIFRAPYVAQLSVRRETDLAGQNNSLSLYTTSLAPLRAVHDALEVICSQLTPSSDDQTSLRKYRPAPMLEW